MSFAIAFIALTVLYRAQKVSKNPMVRRFMWFFVFAFMWKSAFLITFFVENRIEPSHGFLLLGLTFIARICAQILVPKYEKVIFWVSLATVVVVMFTSVHLLGSQSPLDLRDAVPVVLAMFIILSSIILLPAIILFFYQSFKQEDSTVSVRSFFLGAGFSFLLFHVLGLILIPSHGAITWISGEALNILALSLLLAGILYKGPEEKKSPLPKF